MRAAPAFVPHFLMAVASLRLVASVALVAADVCHQQKLWQLFATVSRIGRCTCATSVHRVHSMKYASRQGPLLCNLLCALGICLDTQEKRTAPLPSPEPSAARLGREIANGGLQESHAIARSQS